jgi:hypothetical protein
MIIRYFLIIALVFSGFSTGAYAAKPAYKAAHKSVAKHAIKKVAYKGVMKRIVKAARKPGAKQPVKVTRTPVVSLVKVTPKPVATPVVNVQHNPPAKPEVKEIVKFDFSKDDLKVLSKSNDDKGHVFLQIGNKDKDDDYHYDGHDNGHNDHVNAVPVPAALWLFGSALLGLLGARRKSA